MTCISLFQKIQAKVRSSVDEGQVLGLASREYNKVFELTKDRQRKKFDTLRWKSLSAGLKITEKKVGKEEKASLSKRWIKKFTDYPLTPDKESLLKKGLKFCIIPNKVP